MVQQIAFLHDLWGTKPDDSAILIWSLASRHSAFFTDVQEASEYALLRANHDDVYVGAGLRPRGFPSDKRGGNDDITGIGGLWLDVDIIDPVHRKANLFETNDVAVRFASDTTSLTPTYIIHTGHGIQVWWLFNEVVMFDSALERRSYADLSRRWVNTFRFRAHEKGYDIDALHDLSRIFRIPNTFNRKREPILPVRVIDSNTYRYSPEDFEPFLLESPITPDDTITDVGPYVISLQAEPPFTKFELLCDNNAKFRQSWQHKRRDMPDSSMSSFDLSLATLAARAGWSTQEIVDLLIAHRRMQNALDKAHNWPDYFTRTLRKALANASHEGRQATILTEIQQSEDPEQTLDALARLFGGIKITKIVKYMSDPPSYRLDTELGGVNLGQITGLTTQSTFTQHVANATRLLIPKMKDDKWRQAVQTMLSLLVEESAGIESTDEGAVHDWLSAFLAAHPPTDNMEDAYRTQASFRDTDGIFFFGHALRRFLHLTYGERIQSRDMGALLRAFGCVPLVKTFDMKDGKRATRHVWSLPTKRLFQ